MPKYEPKQVVIDEIKSKLEKAKSVVLVDSRGLTVAQDTTLRKVLRENKVDYKVYKNTMLSFAIKDTSFSGLSSFLFGPTAVAVSYDDPTSAAAAINKQFKTMPKLEFKGGVVDNIVYDAEGMKAIADIPSREVLLSQLLGSFKAPIASFARLAAAIAESMGGGPASEETPAEA
ncbi:MAG: 50S ribosomal protein L10 [Clostridiales bacterium]|jgi:large subunit ribosomal protein L10|nr:50S ribosomal protein L10 [Clostridiales bacterium]